MMEQEQVSLNLAKAKAGHVTTEHQRQEKARAESKKPSLTDLSKQFDFTSSEVAKMVKEEEKDLADKDAGGGQLVGGGKSYKGDDGTEANTTPTTAWHMMPRSARQREAARRVRDRLLEMKDSADDGPTRPTESGDSQPPKGTESHDSQPTGGRGGKPKGRSIAEIQRSVAAMPKPTAPPPPVQAPPPVMDDGWRF
jgi:hypothetical protein